MVSGTLDMPDFKPTANNVHTMFATRRLSSVVCPVRGGVLGQWEGDSLSSWKMWVSVKWEGRHSQLVVLGTVGEIGRTDGI